MKVREQHYVPKFFLRRFSVQENEKTIGVFNRQTQKYVPEAPLRSQACKPYFYGKDGKLEELFGTMEGLAADLLRRVSSRSWLPKPQSDDWMTLLIFLLTSELRTPAHIEKMMDMSKNLYNATFIEQEILPKNADEFKVSHIQAIETSMSLLRNAYQCCSDLSMILLKNESNQNFITCDNPVIKYNQFLEKRKHQGGITGYATMGLQIFLPIDSSTIILIYDQSTYRVGNKKDLIIKIDKPKDVNQLNLLSLINCNRVVFFNEKISQQYMINLLTECTKHPPANVVVFHNYYSTGKEGDYEYFKEHKPDELTDSLFHSYTTVPRIRLNLSFISETKKARSTKTDGHGFVKRKTCNMPDEPTSTGPYRFEYEEQ